MSYLHVPKSCNWVYFTVKLYLRKTGVLRKVSCKYHYWFWSYKENLLEVFYPYGYIQWHNMILNVKNKITKNMFALHESWSFALAHFTPMFCFYTPRKRPKNPRGFLAFSGGYKWNSVKWVKKVSYPVIVMKSVALFRFVYCICFGCFYFSPNPEVKENQFIKTCYLHWQSRIVRKGELDLFSKSAS